MVMEIPSANFLREGEAALAVFTLSTIKPVLVQYPDGTLVVRKMSSAAEAEDLEACGQFVRTPRVLGVQRGQYFDFVDMEYIEGEDIQLQAAREARLCQRATPDAFEPQLEASLHHIIRTTLLHLNAIVTLARNGLHLQDIGGPSQSRNAILTPDGELVIFDPCPLRRGEIHEQAVHWTNGTSVAMSACENVMYSFSNFLTLLTDGAIRYDAYFKQHVNDNPLCSMAKDLPVTGNGEVFDQQLAELEKLETAPLGKIIAPSFLKQLKIFLLRQAPRTLLLP